ncbi:hypothetical protein [Aliikangiella coralliicola]|uniref:Carboxymuconolactone decarboxylase family protein n=1 Tax=Aliikangiella coralliicola TaxID=2592383 RepID=A0A545UFR8_9GAMM|nr:hypothetical protein [Aliikangiella coralliicola]TQV88324.1 hypothetical protein FLL46_07305 [Aliikangiella coralliicola]
MTQTEHLQLINEFETHYGYDSQYMRDLLKTSPSGYQKFSDMLPLARHNELLDAESYWVSKFAAMKVQDCGECLQLNVKMALESDIDTEIVVAAVKDPDSLSNDLRDLYDYSTSIAKNEASDNALTDRMKARFSKGQLLEIGLSVSTAALFPTIKRALGITKSCSIIDISI